MTDKRKVRILGLTAAVLALIAFAFLSRPEQPLSASAPYLNVRVLHMQPGQTSQLKLVRAKNVKWKSLNRSVATVRKGKVTAKKAGKATITAKKGKKTYKCWVTVASGKKKTLIVYFSATGTTRGAAQKLKKAADADIVRLVPRRIYKKSHLNYNKDCRANSEQDKNTYVPIATRVRDLRRYDTICLGYPIWWGKEPGVIREFLKLYNLENRTVLPFCTSGGSGISGSMGHVRNLAKGAKVKNGKDLTDATADEIRKWFKQNTAK